MRTLVAQLLDDAHRALVGEDRVVRARVRRPLILPGLPFNGAGPGEGHPSLEAGWDT